MSGPDKYLRCYQRNSNVRGPHSQTGKCNAIDGWDVISVHMPRGAHRAVCEKWAILDPFILLVTPVTTVFPHTVLLRFLLSPNTQISSNKFKQTMFHTENARLLPESAAFALWT